MMSLFKETRRPEQNPFGGPPLELNSDFGAIGGDALDLVERRYGDRGLVISRERYNSSRDAEGDIVCTARDGEHVIGTMSVRFDGQGGLHTDLMFEAELSEWRAAGVKLCEFGGLAVDRDAPESKRVLAQLFHLGYLHAYKRARCERLVVEVNPRHVAFYRRWLGLLPFTTARHNPRVDAPSVLMSVDFETIREQIALWGGRPETMPTARCLYPLVWGPAAEAAMLARLG